MKKIKALIICCFLLGLLTTNAFAAEQCNLVIDGVSIQSEAPEYDIQPQIYTDVVPEVKGEQAFVPLRFISELFGAEVNYDSGEVSITYAGKTLKM